MNKHLNKKWVTISLAAVIGCSAMGTAHAEVPTHEVQPADSLWKLAKANRVTIAQLKEWNQLKSDTIYDGQILYLAAPDIRYTVKSNDTLFLMAKAFNVSIADIKLRNRLSSNLVYGGQILFIPAQKGVYTSHTVIAKETLESIAIDYGITLASLKAYNGFTSEAIAAGQAIQLPPAKIIPAPRTTDVKAPTFLADGQFPLAKGTYTAPIGDTWGDSRKFGGDRHHEGTDIIAAIGTPIYAVTDGVIVNYGWNQLGGWRLAVKTAEGYNLYFAHMSKYADGMAKGVTVKKGQLIGYVGNTGYGPEGTSGEFDSHLHFGMYDSNWAAMNPYDHLKYWESKVN